MSASGPPPSRRLQTYRGAHSFGDRDLIATERRRRPSTFSRAWEGLVQFHLKFPFMKKL